MLEIQRETSGKSFPKSPLEKARDVVKTISLGSYRRERGGICANIGVCIVSMATIVLKVDGRDVERITVSIKEGKNELFRKNFDRKDKEEWFVRLFDELQKKVNK